MLPPSEVTQALRDELLGTISAVARRARLELDLTQLEVGRQIGVSAEYYGRIERGHVLPSVPTLRRMASALDTDVDVLLGLRAEGSPRSARREVGVVRTSYLEPDPPQLGRLVRRLRTAPPDVLHIVNKLIVALERRINDI